MKTYRNWSQRGDERAAAMLAFEYLGLLLFFLLLLLLLCFVGVAKAAPAAMAASTAAWAMLSSQMLVVD